MGTKQSAQILDMGATTGGWFQNRTRAEVDALIGTTNRLVSLQMTQTSPPLFTGTMVANSGTHGRDWTWYYDLTPQSLQGILVPGRWRSISLDAYIKDGTLHYATVVVRNSGVDDQGWWTFSGDVAGVQTQLDQHDARLIDLRRVRGGSSNQVVALMVSNTGPHETNSWWYAGQTMAQVTANLTANNAYLVSLSPADASGSTFDVVMNQAPTSGIGWGWYVGIDESQLDGFSAEYQTRPVDVQRYVVNGQPRFATILLQNSWTETQQNQAACDASVLAQWQATPTVTGIGTPSTTAAFDNLIVPMMQAYGIPGGSISVVRDGELVLARGYGFSDQSRARLVHPDDIFRIASVSKQITSAAVLKLVDQGLIQLTDTPFTILDLAPNPATNVDHTQLNSITVTDLLHHAGGFSRNPNCNGCLTIGDPLGPPTTWRIEADQHLNTGVCTGNDPVTCGLPPNCDQMIQWVRSLPDSETLLWQPGTTEDYSNFGYCVLGALIEQVTGSSYNDWVRSNILLPAGAVDIRPGLTLTTQDREVSYYDRDDNQLSVFSSQTEVIPINPYGDYYVESSPASGGWTASTIDLLRFQAALDGRGGRTPLLSPARIADLTRPPGIAVATINPTTNTISAVPANPNAWYGMGWYVDSSDKWSHTGALYSTAALQIRLGNGFGMAAFFNAWPPNVNSSISASWNTTACKGDFFCNLNQAFQTALNNAGGVNGDWFSEDLFDHYGNYTSWLTSEQYQAFAEVNASLGRYPSRVDAVNLTGTPLFRAVFARLRGHSMESHHNLDCLAYQETDARLQAAGYTQTSLQAYVANDGTRRYQSTWVEWSACSPSCSSGGPCTADADCNSGICSTGTCQPSACAPTCGMGADCGSNADCLSEQCTAGKCAAPLCSPSCAGGAACSNNSNCSSFVCSAGACAPPWCAAQPGKCGQGSPCGANGDCGSGICSAGTCQPPACAPSCQNGTTCANNSDCSSSVCGTTSFTCESPGCATQPGKCTTGAPCGTNSDCGSGTCTGGICQPPAGTGGTGGTGGSANLVSTFDYFSTWGTGYCARLQLTNTGTVATTGWTAVLNTGSGPVNSSFNPTFSNGTGLHTLSGVANVNAIIQPGQTVPVGQRPGFCVQSSGAPPSPILVSLVPQP